MLFEFVQLFLHIAKVHCLLEKRYYASTYGRIKDSITEQIYPTEKSKSNLYLTVKLKCKNGEKKSFLIHRLIAQTFISNSNNYNIVNHIDGNKQNNNINNLEWCTQSHNMLCWWKIKNKGE